MAPRRNAFTYLELIITILMAVVLVAMLLPAMGGSRRSPTMKDALQIRGFQMAFTQFAQNNAGTFPLASEYDKNNARWTGTPESKHTTANIFSLLLAENLATPEMCVSPVESNPAIRLYQEPPIEQSSTDTPSPQEADPPYEPQLLADFTTGQGNISYAHLQPSGDRLNRWSIRAGANDPILANRGPEITSADHKPDGSPVPSFRTASSFAFRNQMGKSGQWAGNVVFGDGSVRLTASLTASQPNAPTAPQPRYQRLTASGIQNSPDLIHYDEPDDALETANTLLGIFVKSGKTPGEFRAIWD